MKVLIAVHHFPPRYTGGAEWRAYRTAVALQKRGHDVRVVCIEHIDAGPETGVAWEDSVYGGIAVRRLSFNLALAPAPGRWRYDNPWIGDHLRNFLKEDRPDVFHLIGGYLLGADVIRAASGEGLPVIVTLTDFWFICPRITLLRSDGQICAGALPRDCVRCLAEEKRRYRWPAQALPWLMDRLWASFLVNMRNLPAPLADVEHRRRTLTAALNQVDLAICPSEFLRQVYIRAGAPADRLAHSRQGIEPPKDARLKSSSAALRFGYIGQLAEHKGVHLLIKAFTQLEPRTRPVTLTIYGDPTRFPRYVKRLQKLAANRPDIRFAGAYSHSDLSLVMSGLDVIVVPSIWYENSPNAILEAFFYRTPVVASDLGGMRELVEHGKSGLLFAPGNVDDLRKQLQRLVDEPELLQHMSASIPSVRTVEEEIMELEGLYQRATTRPREPIGCIQIMEAGQQVSYV